MRNALSLAAVLAIAGCNTYELDPVKPAGAKLAKSPVYKIAAPAPPDVVFVIDRSGSMSDSVDGSASRVCPSAGQQNANCKWDELLSVMTGSNGFLSNLQATQSYPSDPMRMGLVTFSGSTDPSSTSISEACTPGVLAVPLAAGQADAVSAALEAIPPAGATPTASSLAIAASAFPSGETNTRKRFVVLLTDGAPNCNPSADLSASTCGGDRCTMSCDATTGIATDPRGCLDENGLVTAVAALRDQDIITMVIGFGADVTGGAAFETLEHAAIAGGARRIDSSGNPMEPAFYSAQSASDLQAALGQGPYQGGSCIFQLDAPPATPSTLEVDLATCNQPLQPLGAEKYRVDNAYLTITDPTLCAQMKTSTVDCPMSIEFTYLAQ